MPWWTLSSTKILQQRVQSHHYLNYYFGPTHCDHFCKHAGFKNKKSALVLTPFLLKHPWDSPRGHTKGAETDKIRFGTQSLKQRLLLWFTDYCTALSCVSLTGSCVNYTEASIFLWAGVRRIVLQQENLTIQKKNKRFLTQNKAGDSVQITKALLNVNAVCKQHELGTIVAEHYSNRSKRSNVN